MSNIKIGVDIVEVKKSRALMCSQVGKCMLEREFTPSERTYIGNCPYKMSGIFAVKEAFYKALGTGWLGGQNVEVVHESSGKPAIKLYGEAKRKANKMKSACSITYSSDYAIAAVVLF